MINLWRCWSFPHWFLNHTFPLPCPSLVDILTVRPQQHQQQLSGVAGASWSVPFNQYFGHHPYIKCSGQHLVIVSLRLHTKTNRIGETGSNDLAQLQYQPTTFFFSLILFIIPKPYNIKFAILSAKFCGVKYIIVVQPSPCPLSCKTETLYPLDNNFLLDSPWQPLFYLLFLLIWLR